MRRATGLAAVFSVLAFFAFGCGDPDEPSDGDADGDADTGDSGPDECDGCEVGDECVPDGARNPESPCEVCDAAEDGSGWSADDGASCDDGLYCNGADSCSGGSCSEHGGDPCGDDGVFCNGAESCDEEADGCSSSGDPCGEDETCYESEAACCAASASLGCNVDGDVVSLDSCGHEEEVVEDCPTIEHGACGGGACGCEPGFGGEGCTGCVVYVSGDDGDDAADGRSWATARATVQAGIDLAAPDHCEVWVAAAAEPYLPTQGAGGRDLTILLRDGTRLYGGFAGDEVVLDQRDPEGQETVLSGDLGTAGDPSDNACHVVTGGEGALIDGFTITLGRAECDGGSDGGGLIASGVDMAVVGCVFEDNEAAGDGGGLSSFGGTVTVSSCAFRANRAENGGGAAVGGADGTTTFEECAFDGNDADGDGGGLAVLDGAAEVVGCELTGNEAAGEGGGFFLADGTLDLTDTTAAENGAGGQGGGGAAAFGRVSAFGCVFRDNEATGDGGGFGAAVDWEGSDTLLERCAFFGNVAGGSGGGAAFGECRSPEVRNCDFVGNTAAVSEGGLRSGDGECYTDVFNSIIWGNSAPSAPDTGWFRCHNWLHNVVGGTDCAGENHNLDVDPRLVNADPTAGPIDLTLLPTSPCIDAGYDGEATTEDILGVSWVDDPLTPNCDGSDPTAPDCAFISDIGLYEYVP